MAATKDQEARAEAPRMTTKDRETRLLDIRRRTKDVVRNHPNEVERNENVYFGAGVFKDQQFLLGEIERLRKLLGKRATEKDEEPEPEPKDDDEG